MRGAPHDPAECQGVTFTQNGYHECVLVNPMQAAPSVSVCANEGGRCSCTGMVHYGKRYINHKPGKGKENSFEQAKALGLKSKWVDGSITCIPEIWAEIPSEPTTRCAGVTQMPQPLQPLIIGKVR